MKPLLSLALMACLVAPALGKKAPDNDADHEAIKAAIAKGVDALKKMHGDTLGEVPGRKPIASGIPGFRVRKSEHNPVGVAALAGLALLECGVDPKDDLVKETAAYLRSHCIELTHTYSLSLCNMFFDRLGDPNDVVLMESITVRLLAGQDVFGGWTYDCPPISKPEVRRLTALVSPEDSAKKPKKPAPKKEKSLTPEIKAQLSQIQRAQQQPGLGGRFRTSDNSNTQFAILGLWVARKHGLPVDQALMRCDKRFRGSQNPDGGWGYRSYESRADESTPAMTCAALIGLAVGQGTSVLRTDGGRGAAGKGRDLGKDPVIRDGLIALGSALGESNERTKRGVVPKLGEVNTNYYFLWSLERVAVIYGLQTIGSKDWYAWGSELLIANQAPTGGWTDQVNTCFALLFLAKANVAKDLTASLKGEVSDPGKVVLKAGDSAKNKKLKPAIDPEAKAPNEAPKMDDLAPIPVPEVDPDLMPEPEPEPKPEPKPQPKPVVADEPPDADKLCAKIVESSGDQRGNLIKKYRDTKGSEYTEALTKAIHKLNGDGKSQCQTALADRFVRMSANTLRAYLQNEDKEVRRAAVRASAAKDDRALVPDLIPLLDDGDPILRNMVLRSLKTLTDKDFGPDADAKPDDRAKAIKRWQEWWRLQPGK